MKTALMRRPIRTLIHDDFIIPRASPIGSTLKAEPGPGMATVTDTGSKMSISGSQLLTASNTVSGSDPKLAWPDQGSRPGIAVVFRPRCSNSAGTTTNFGVSNIWFQMTSGTPKLKSASLDFAIGQRIANVAYAIVIDPLGAKLFLGGAFGAPGTPSSQAVYGRPPASWALMWVYRGAIDSAAWLSGNTTATFSPDSVAVYDFGAGHPLATSYGIARERIVNPASGATFQACGEASLIEFNWTAATGETAEIQFRIQDADNKYILRMSQGGSTIKFIRVDAGAETELRSQAATFSDGVSYRISLRFTASVTHYFIDNSPTNNATTGATSFLSSTGCLIQGFSTASELTVWALDVTGFFPVGV